MRNRKKIKVFVLLIAILLVVSVFGAASVVATEEDIVISIDPPSKTISAGETFTVNVFCTPSQPIKAYEFKIMFDSSLLQANSVSEGNIFDGYTTFFNNGIIDNSAGTIINIFGLIVGAFHVSDTGTLISISFTAKSNNGISSLTLYSVGICDENGYLPYLVNNGKVTIEDGDPSPLSPPPEAGFPSYPLPDDNDINSPPITPIDAFGPNYVEIGVVYAFTVSTIDPDGDDIRYRFDWGDGSLSQWSNFTISGEPVVLYHSWNTVDTYQLYCIAQDIHGLNSSWDYVFDVIVSGIERNGSQLIADFIMSGDLTTNASILFDASGSYDPNGTIVSYEWDFGDGIIGSGRIVSHVYTQPGTYIITLVVTDNFGNMYTKKITRTIEAENPAYDSADEQKESGMSVVFFYIFIGGVVAVLMCLVVVYKQRIQILMLNRRIKSVSMHDQQKKK